MTVKGMMSDSERLKTRRLLLLISFIKILSCCVIMNSSLLPRGCKAGFELPHHPSTPGYKLPP